MNRQRELIEQARLVTVADPRLQAAWIGGSFASGMADEWSDIDVHVLVDDQDLDAMRVGWKDLATQISPMVMMSPIGGVVGGWAITPDWQHVDIVCLPRSAFDPAWLAGCVPLFDRAGLLPAEAQPPPASADDPYFPEQAVTFYFYLLGNLAVVLSRGELVLASNGAIMRRDTGLVPIMLAENGVRKAGGNKRLNRYLTAAQRDFLESLPPVSADRDSVIAFDRLVAAEVISRGRKLAAATGADWPADFERATLDYLRSELSMEITHCGEAG